MHLLLILSLLSWERGLKSYRSICDIRRLGVAPLVGAWIEIRALAMKILEETVAPLVGAWIEITKSRITQLILSSLLSWERGLKLRLATIHRPFELSLLSWERGLKLFVRGL